MFDFFNNKNNDTTTISISKAIESQNVNSIISCIENGTSPDSMYHSMRLLYYVILKMNNNIKLIEFLLQNGASISKKNDDFDDISTEYYNKVLLKNYEYDIVVKRFSETPLDIVMEKNNTQIIKLFLKYNPRNITLIEWFINNKIQDETLLDILIKHNKMNYNLLNKLLILYPENKALKNDVEEAYYLNHTRLVNGITLLYNNILDKNIVKIKNLLKYDVDVTQRNSDNSEMYYNYNLYREHRNKNSLELSIDIEDMDVLKLLLEYNRNTEDLLHYSILKDKADIVKLLLENGVNPDFLAIACERQNLNIVKLLIEYNVNVNQVDRNGELPLYYAIEAKRANKEIIRVLISNGADINRENNNGISPLSFAESSKVSLVKVLTENKKVELAEDIEENITVNHKNLLEKIVSQNKVINKLKDEVRTIKESNTNNQVTDKYKLQLESFEKTILSQSNEIKELQNKLILKEEDTKNLLDEFMLTVSKLEKKLDAQKKVTKAKIPLNIPTESHSIKKEDGVLVKRESFDDF